MYITRKQYDWYRTKTNTGGRAEQAKVLEVTMLKELGKMTM